jgi:uncharacterized membrane-anchored protein
MDTIDTAAAASARTAPIRVPEVTIYFWIVKVLSTGAGESTSDFLAHRFNPALVAVAGAAGLAVSLVLQFRMRRYVAWTYWFAVLMVAIFGTMAADVLHDGLHIPYLTSTIALAVVLAVIFVGWYRAEHTLSIHSITTRRREGFYWATVIATFAVGTAAGDVTATTLGWGYFISGIVFAMAILVIGLAHALITRSISTVSRARPTIAVFTFWLAYIVTRPLGASLADWAGKPPAKTGLGFGDGTIAFVLIVFIVLFVGYLAATRADVPALNDDERALASGEFA